MDVYILCLMVSGDSFCSSGGENSLEEGNYVFYLDLKSDKDGSGVQLTVQNGWGGDAQSITVPVAIQEGSHVVKLDIPNVVGGL